MGKTKRSAAPRVELTSTISVKVRKEKGGELTEIGRELEAALQHTFDEWHRERQLSSNPLGNEPTLSDAVVYLMRRGRDAELLEWEAISLLRGADELADDLLAAIHNGDAAGAKQAREEIRGLTAVFMRLRSRLSSDDEGAAQYRSGTLALHRLVADAAEADVKDDEWIELACELAPKVR